MLISNINWIVEKMKHEWGGDEKRLRDVQRKRKNTRCLKG